MTENDTAKLAIYVAEEESEVWKKEAEDLNMNYSEYYRLMINAGRRELGLADVDSEESEEGSGGSLLNDRVIDTLSTDETLSFDEICDAVLEAHYEERIAEILQNDDRAQYTPIDGGYILNSQL